MTDIVVVKVKPGSRKGSLVEVGSTGDLTIYVREPAPAYWRPTSNCQDAGSNWCLELCAVPVTPEVLSC
jgi:hypothetical protein